MVIFHSYVSLPEGSFQMFSVSKDQTHPFDHRLKDTMEPPLLNVQVGIGQKAVTQRLYQWLFVVSNMFKWPNCIFRLIIHI